MVKGMHTIGKHSGILVCHLIQDLKVPRFEPRQRLKMLLIRNEIQSMMFKGLWLSKTNGLLNTFICVFN